jgi:hypothetical protein
MGFLHHIRFYNKIVPDDSNYLHTQQRIPRLPRTYPKLPCSPPIENEKAWQRGYSGSTHEEIVISRAYVEAVFLRTG